MEQRKYGCICELNPETGNPVVADYYMCPVHKPNDSLPGMFRKKPVMVEAVLFTDENKDRVYSWAKDIQNNVYHSFDDKNQPILLVPTLEGEMVCAIGDFLIKEPFPIDWRKLYPCKPDIFSKTYERA